MKSDTTYSTRTHNQLRLVCILTLLLLSAGQARSATPTAAGIIEQSGVKGGLVVCIGCGDPKLLTSLRAGDGYLVHGLDADSETIRSARQHIGKTASLNGRITVSRLHDGQLPYVDNLVNLIVITGDGVELPNEEMQRVLVPGGVIADARAEKVRITRKERPADIDDWPHYLYDASNNAVSKDAVVGPPLGMKWTCGPAYAISHEHFGGVSAMVSAGGRVFIIADEGPTSSVFLPAKWKLIARDAFNGVRLWDCAIEKWESRLRGFRSGPPEISRRLIADGKHVYVALNYGSPVSVLDAATGKALHALDGTKGARELLCHDGVLYVLTDDMTADDHEKRKKWIDETAPKLKSYNFPRKPLHMYGKQRLLAIKTDTRKPIWSKEWRAAAEVMPATLAVAEGRVCYQTGSQTVCLNAADGELAWKASRPVARSRYSWSTPSLVVHNGVVLTGDRVAKAEADKTPPKQGSKWLMDSSHQGKKQAAEIIAFALKDGKELWRAPCFENYDTQLDIFVIDGVVWVGELRHSRDSGFTQGRDLRSGKVVKTLPNNKQAYGVKMGHHRCYRNKATQKWLLLGRDGIEFLDPKTGKGSGNWWVRGTCQYGIMPANGLVYAPQHSCACHPAEKLTGFNALSPQSGAPEKPGEGAAQLVKGPAIDAELKPPAATGKGRGWPIYRRDSRRSGFQNLPAPKKLNQAWTARFAPPITPPVIAGGIVYVAETDRHTLHAISARDGKAVWTYVAEGRIDSPPSIYRGRCVFGTRNGFVYCLRASDGALVWRFHAEPNQRLAFSYEQLESVWPVHGSVLVNEKLSGGTPTVYFAAGRSSHLDGGIRILALDLKTGKKLHGTTVTMHAKATGNGLIKRRVLPDVLSIQKESLFMRDMCLDAKLEPQKKLVPHLYAPGGFLDSSWWHRTYWIYGTQMQSAWGGWPRIGNVVPSGRLLVFDGGKNIYGYGRMSYRAGGGHVGHDAAKGYKLFAETLAPQKAAQPAKPPQPKKGKKAGGKRGKKGKRGPVKGKRKQLWAVPLPFLAKSLVLTQDALLVAGGSGEPEAKDRPGMLWVVSRKDGSKLGTCDLPAPTILDGMAFGSTGVYVSTEKGALVCLRGEE